MSGDDTQSHSLCLLLCANISATHWLCFSPECIRRQGQDGTGPRRTSGDMNGSVGTLLQLINLPCGNCFKRSNVTLKPCGHRALCSNCCLQVTECPFCHQYIEERLVSGSSGKVHMSCINCFNETGIMVSSKYFHKSFNNNRMSSTF